MGLFDYGHDIFTCRNMKNLYRGQTVYWHDPDKIASGYYCIIEIENSDERPIKIRNRSGERFVDAESLHAVDYKQQEPVYKLHDRDFYLRFADMFNTRCFKSSVTALRWFYATYHKLTNREWSYGQDYSETYADFLTELFNAAIESGGRMRSPLPAPKIKTGLLAIAPVKPPAIREKGALSLKSVLPRGIYHNALYCGIGVRGSWVYATDGWCLVKIRDGRWGAFDGRIAPYSDYKKALESDCHKPAFLDGTVDYESVIPQKTEHTHVWTWDIQPLNAIMYGIHSVACRLKLEHHRVGLRFSKQMQPVYLNPLYLYSTLRILHANGAARVDLECYDPLKPLLLRADNGNLGVVMPYMQNNNWIISMLDKERNKISYGDSV